MGYDLCIFSKFNFEKQIASDLVWSDPENVESGTCLLCMHRTREIERLYPMKVG